MQADTVQALRDAGIPMRGRHHGSQFGWTTDAQVAETARTIGANVTTVTARDERYSGWEISVPPDPTEDVPEDES